MNWLTQRLILPVLLVIPVVGCGERVVTATVCELTSTPQQFNHKLVRVSGSISRGFEDFTLADQSCRSQNQPAALWLEYGGTVGSRTIYCCGVTPARERSKTLVVDGITTSLIQDSVWRAFESATYRDDGPTTTARATIIGRFFAGRKIDSPDGSETWDGYGHFGMYSLIAIQQIVSVQK